MTKLLQVRLTLDSKVFKRAANFLQRKRKTTPRLDMYSFLFNEAVQFDRGKVTFPRFNRPLTNKELSMLLEEINNYCN